MLGSGRRAGWGDECVWFGELPVLEHLRVLGPLELQDRRIVALEEPLFIWEVEAAGEVQLICDVDLRAERVRYERASDGSRLWLGGEWPTDELLVSCYGGVVEVTEEGSTIQLRARGIGRVRLVVVAARDEGDRDRTVRALTRKGVAGVVAQYVRHLEMVEALGAKLTTPDLELNDQFAFDKRDLDGTLREWPDGHRGLLEPLEHGFALLALGLREAVRDTLRGPLDDPEVLRLFAAYAVWAGTDDFVRRHWPRVTQALREADPGPERGDFLAEEDPPVPIDEYLDAAAELIPVAEALGDHAAAAMLEGMIAGVAVDPVSGPWLWPDPVMKLWGITPGALEGTVTLAPQLPDAWPEMTLERLRIGSTSLDVRVRRRPGGLAVKCRVTRGPPIVVQLAPELPFQPTGILLDGEQLAGPTVRFTVESEAEAVWIR